MKHFGLLLTTATGLLVAAVPLDNTFVQHEFVEHLPQGWKHHADLLRDTPLVLNVALKHDQEDDFLSIVSDVSDPSSSEYGNHISAEAWRTMHSSVVTHRNAVVAWLSEFEAEVMSHRPDSLAFKIPSGRANEMLDTTFSAFVQEDSQSVLPRTQHYSLPRSMQKHVDFIYPTVDFLQPSHHKLRVQGLQARQHIPTGPINCSTSVCPPQLKTKYNIDYFPKDSFSGSKIGITGFIGNVANETDVKQFVQKHGAKNGTVAKYRLEHVNGGAGTADNSALQVEASLDLDYSLSFTGPLDATFYTTGGAGAELKQPGNVPVPANESQNEPYLAFLDYILAQEHPPQVISISYTDDEQSVPQKYANKVCNKFAQAAARGISVIASSGDGGAVGTSGSDCQGPDGKHRFVPGFPATCPWVTAVGATASYGGPASYSGGGFSNYFARPTWQEKQVQSYIKALNGSHAGLYNAAGRAIPDVSLIGDNYLIQVNGFEQQASGTSASTPVFAAMVALLNDIRLRQGKPVLGFLNPLLYAQKAKQVYTDVVSDVAATRGCASGDFFEEGWQALAGWDAATGLGESDFKKLRKVLV